MENSSRAIKYIVLGWASTGVRTFNTYLPILVLYKLPTLITVSPAIDVIIYSLTNQFYVT